MGTYIDRDDVEQQFGVGTISDWATLDDADSAATILARINAAISYAEGYFEARLRPGRYALPLSVSGNGLALIQHPIAIHAGAWLYRSSGMRDSEEDGSNKLSRMVKEADSIINQIASGTLRLDSTLSHDGPTAPTVV